MKNTLNDLNNYLFEQIEILTDEDDNKKLDDKIKKSKAIFQMDIV